MKAILKSDIAYLRTALVPTFVTFVLVYVLLCWAAQSPLMISTICGIIPLLVLLTFVSADAPDRWGRYRAALPFSRRDIVASRYAIILLSSLGVIVLGVALAQIANVVAPLAMNDFEPMSLFDSIATCVTSTTLVLILVDGLNPFLVKFGNARGIRYATIAFLVLFALAIYALSQLFNSETMDALGQWVANNGGLLVAVLAAVALAATAISCMASLRIYTKKDL